MYVSVAVDELAEQSRTPMKTRKSHAYQTSRDSSSKHTKEDNKITFHRLPLLGERTKEWLITSRRDEGPTQFIVGTESMAKKDILASISRPAGMVIAQPNLAFDTVTRRNGHCTIQPRL